MTHALNYTKDTAYVESLENDNTRWLLEIARLRKVIEEKNEKIRELSKFQLHCYKHTDFRG